MNKSERRAAIRARAERAISNMYHNATLPWIKYLHGRTEEEYSAWLQGACEFELEYIQSGGAYGGNYRKTLEHPANSGHFKSPAARNYYIRKGLRDAELERADCGILTGWRALELAAGNRHVGKLMARYPGAARNDALWELVAREYGKIYQYGRGGRTVAPSGLWNDRTNCPRWNPEEHSITTCMKLIRIIESFNRHVTAWCASVPEQWREHCAEEDAEKAREKRARAARKAKETRERKYWACRDVVTV